MLKDNLPWIIVGLVVLAIVIGGVVVSRVVPEVTAALGRRGRGRPPREHFRAGDVPEVALKRAIVIVNPTKFADLHAVRDRIAATCQTAGWGEPVFHETTVDDHGAGPARRAVEEGADLVCSLGGDGTVRSVASALIGTDVPLGILPAGTGNLLARNLDLPPDDIDAAMTAALTGRNRRIDVGELSVTDADGATATHHFLVMAGLGMDAAIMAGTNENLKRSVGWPAYMVSGLKHLVSPEFRVTVQVDSGPEFRRRSRMVVVGNCGRLLGGLVLMPDARVDDGHLDTVIASPRGVVGWVPVATSLVTRSRKGHPRLEHRPGRSVRLRTDRLLPVQIDGDVIGESAEIRAVVRPGVLTVRVSHL